MFVSSPFHHLSDPAAKRHTELPQPKTSQHAQSNRQRLLTPDGARDRATGQDDAGQQTQLYAVRLAVCDAVAAQPVQGADGAAGCDRGDRTRAYIAHCTAAGGQAGEDVGDVSGGVRRAWWEGMRRGLTRETAGFSTGQLRMGRKERAYHCVLVLYLLCVCIVLCGENRDAVRNQENNKASMCE